MRTDMTSRERILETCAHRAVDHVPLHLEVHPSYLTYDPAVASWKDQFERTDALLALGADAMVEVWLPDPSYHPDVKIRTWKEYRRVLQEVYFIIVLRRGGHRQKVEKLLREENIPCDRESENPGLPPAAFLHAYDSDYLELSATDIRKKMSRGQDVSPYVEKNVRQIMEEIKLYEEG